MPSLSDDYHRYVWDGRVQLAGINPYSTPPLRARARPRAVLGTRPDQPRGAADDLPAPDAGAVPRRGGGVARGRAQDVAKEPAGASPIRAGDIPRDAPRAARRSHPLQARLRRIRPGHRGGGLAPGREEAPQAGHGALPALPCSHPADVGVGARGGGGDAVLRARRRPARPPARRLGRRRARPRRRAQGHAARTCSCRRCWAAAPHRPRFLAGFVPAFALPYVPYLLTGGSFGSLFESGSGWTGGSLLFTLLARLTTPEAARWLSLALFLGGAVWIAGSFSGREKTAEALRLDLHPAHPVPAGRARLVLADSARAGPGRRPLAAAADRHGGPARRVAAARGEAGARRDCGPSQAPPY